MDDKDKKIKELTLRINDLIASNDEFRRVTREAMRSLFSKKKGVENVENLGGGLVTRANELLIRWGEWSQLTSEEYTQKYGEAPQDSDSQEVLVKLTIDYLDGDGRPFVKEKKLIREMIYLLRRGIRRHMIDGKVTFTLLLDLQTQDLIVKAIDEIDRIRKEIPDYE